MHTRLSLVALTMLASTAQAEWVVDNAASRLSFVSTKAGAVAEVHRFTSLAGRVDDRGNVEITISLASVDTLIPVRDERLRELLFETASFPTATLTAKVDPAFVAGLAPGVSRELKVEAMLNLHGQQGPVALDLVVARLGGERLLVTTREPVVVNAAQVGLTEGVERLRAIAQLPSISPSVPVSFVLSLTERR